MRDLMREWGVRSVLSREGEKYSYERGFGVLGREDARSVLNEGRCEECS